MKEQFLQELSELLDKYKVDIHFQCEGDTYGIRNERMIITMGKEKIHENNGNWLEL